MQLPIRQVGPSGRVPVTAGNYTTGAGLGAPGRELAETLGQTGKMAAGVAGMIAERRDKIALEQARATVSDKMVRLLAEQDNAPVLDDKGNPKTIDLDEISGYVDKEMDSWRTDTQSMSQQAKDRMEMYLLDRRAPLIQDIYAKRSQKLDNWFHGQGRDKIFSFFRSGRTSDGNHLLDTFQSMYPEQADEAEGWAFEGNFWGKVENEGASQAIATLKQAPEAIAPERKTQLAEAAKRYETALKRKTAANSFLQQRQDALSALDMVDADSAELTSFLTTHENLSNLDEQVDAKGVVVGFDTLTLWKANRNKAVATDHGVKLDMIGQALEAADSKDQYDFRMRLANARYSNEGKLSQEDYEAVKALLAKGYQSHETGLLTAGYYEIDRKKRWASGYGGFYGYAGKVPISYQEKTEQFKTLASWFDSERKQNNLPSVMDTVAYAREIGVNNKAVAPGVGEKPVVGRLFQDEDAQWQAIMEGLSDSDRDAVMELRRTMTADQFMAKYKKGKNGSGK